ncbi:helix-turn-helix transcriptional regulator [Rhizomonospora bruguierae]|uniref:helix-turn-helix transcriptional regulator n=1 Tax=Rhizomonospora bruguierae TaxID=1581705 RepID=UPI001BCF19B0|nr:transcriptional regulator [Micromonospora sp. NBRC 107566]
MPIGHVQTAPTPLRTFGDSLKIYRERRRLSQAGLAKLVHVSSATIAKVERGRRWPAHDLVVRCDTILGAGGTLTRLWPALENERARRQLLGAQHRLSTKLQAIPIASAHSAEVGPQGGTPSFLSTGVWTIITPLKQEAIRARPVVAVEDVLGAQRLGEIAQAHGLVPSYETVPLGGAVDLNRPNLVVICGPRLSPHTAAVLNQDQHLRFIMAPGNVWTLHDTGTDTLHRSGLDSAPPRASDVAYLGRLPRPDRRGTLTIFTGIHLQGSLGVVHYLSQHLTELDAELGGRCFSMLLGITFDPETSEPLLVKPLSRVYLQEAHTI